VESWFEEQRCRGLSLPQQLGVAAMGLALSVMVGGLLIPVPRGRLAWHLFNNKTISCSTNADCGTGNTCYLPTYGGQTLENQICMQTAAGQACNARQ